MDVDSESHNVCDNCDAKIPESKFFLHQAYCLRNIRRCPKCNLAIDKSEMEQHEEEVHKIMTCKHCKVDMEAPLMKEHEGNCEYKPKMCIYCDCMVLFEEFETHIEACANRTRQCTYCNRPIRVKDLAEHEPVCMIAIQEDPNYMNEAQYSPQVDKQPAAQQLAGDPEYEVEDEYGEDEEHEPFYTTSEENIKENISANNPLKKYRLEKKDSDSGPSRFFKSLEQPKNKLEELISQRNEGVGSNDRSARYMKRNGTLPDQPDENKRKTRQTRGNNPFGSQPIAGQDEESKTDFKKSNTVSFGEVQPKRRLVKINDKIGGDQAEKSNGAGDDEDEFIPNPRGNKKKVTYKEDDDDEWNFDELDGYAMPKRNTRNANNKQPNPRAQRGNSQKNPEIIPSDDSNPIPSYLLEGDEDVEMMRAIEESLKATASNTVNEFTNSNTVPQTSQDEFSKTSLPGEKKAKKILRKNTGASNKSLDRQGSNNSNSRTSNKANKQAAQVEEPIYENVYGDEDEELARILERSQQEM